MGDAASPAVYRGGKATCFPSHSMGRGCSATSATLKGGAGDAAAPAACRSSIALAIFDAEQKIRVTFVAPAIFDAKVGRHFTFHGFKA